MTTEALLSPDSFECAHPRPERCAIVLDGALGPGFAANAAALLALTLGARCPGLPGETLQDAAGHRHPGLYPTGLPILRASAAELADLHARALAVDGVGVIVLPAAGQRTTDYDAFRDAVAACDTASLEPAGMLIAGPARAVRRLTGSFGLLR